MMKQSQGSQSQRRYFLKYTKIESSGLNFYHVAMAKIFAIAVIEALNYKLTVAQGHVIVMQKDRKLSKVLYLIEVNNLRRRQYRTPTHLSKLSILS